MKRAQHFRRAHYYLIMIMTVIVFLVEGATLGVLYTVGFEQQRQRLLEIVESRAGMIEAMAAGDDANAEAVLAQVEASHARFAGFGQSGEFTLASLDGDQIRFLLRHRHGAQEPIRPIAMTDTLAEPMRRALQNTTGTVVGADYRGVRVLAAHHPIGTLGWGIVAKIDVTEIQAPYVRAVAYGVLGSLVLIIAGSRFFIRVLQPMVAGIERQRQYNRMLFNESPMGLVLSDMEGNLIDVNPAFADLIGYTTEEACRLSYWDITPGKYHKQEEAILEQLYTTGRYGPYDKEYIHKDGHRFEVRLSGTLIQRDGTAYIWSTAQDITEAKRQEALLRQASLVFDHTHEGIMVADASAAIIRINATFSKITGYLPEEVLGENPRLLQSGRHDDTFYAAMWQQIATEGSWYGELWNRRKNGEVFATLQSITSVVDEAGRITGYVSVFSDISEIKSYQDRLSYQAKHDPLTSLPNRIHFNDYFDQMIRSARRHGRELGVLFLDLNRFKSINDTLGHKAGDTLLQTVATRLRDNIREEDIAARLGGDEFAVVLNDVSRENVVKVARKLLQAICEPVTLEGQTLTPSISIGISRYPRHALNAEQLLHAADKAMYRAKKSGENIIAWCDDAQEIVEL